ncbi:uncharacterized protein LOC122855190 [Aphidius gifuensis]|uniref:uncharacterized protein LOC122855190 n=1 Tax=Aphidius gifuensis TaxID=684658 RepID=UPI001CDC0436|nr:uncharacterized protein LOC122855190 [Aphidius gifuensis]
MPYRLENLLNTTMGNVKSKRKEKNENIYKKNDKKKSNLSQDLTNDSYDKWLNDPDMKILRKTLEHNPEIFILNNLMMCVQFFENFDEEMRIIRESPVSSRETEFNSCLPVQKHALVPDILQEQVAKKIDFAYAKHDIFCIEPLQQIRVFIVFDNVEVTEQNYASPYSSMNEALIYNMQLKQSEHKGYVMLQRLEVNPSKKKTNTNHNDAIYSDDNESVYSTNNKSTIDTVTSHQDKKSSGSGSSSLLDEDITNYDYNNNSSSYNDKIVQKLIKNNDTINNSLIKSNELSTSSSDSTSSGYRSGNYTIDSDSDGSNYPQSRIYNKTKILSLNDKKLIINNNINNSEIPKNCFTLIAEDKIYNCRKDRKQKFNNNNTKEKIIKSVLYNRNYGVLCLNSTKFMNWFYDFFTNELSEIMGFNNNDQEPDGAVIYRDKLEILDPPVFMKDDNFGIIPCIWSSWPSIANEWLDRTRGTWPSVNIIEKIRESGCYIIPEGYYTENINNNLQNIEWELTFPAAERYLETSMSSSQTRVYIISLLLQKTFFKPVNSIIGLTDLHIKNQLFWLIEEDDRQLKFTENRTGEFLLKLLNSLYKSISQDVPVLQDYFIKDKNLFQGKIYLLRSQKQLKRIIENPIMYILHAMQNIRHSKKFFPKFDCGKLLKILTEDVLLLINPQLVKKNISKSMSKLNDIEKDYEQTTGFWGSAKQINESSRIYGKKTITNKTLIDAETSYDQVIEIAVRCAEMEPRRLNLLLDFFISHFIKIAEYHHNYKSMIQKNLYIEHAERLAVLLSENSIDKNDAKIHLDKIKIMKEKSTNTRLKINAPKTPKRNSDQPIFVTTLKDRYKSMVESQISLSNIEDSNLPKNEIPQDDLSLIKQIDSTVQKKHVTMAIVHEDELESSEQRHQDKTTSELPNVISLTKSKDSILNETTYI